MPASPVRSPQTRKELIAVAAFCAITFCVPLIVRELYPFSTPTMFSFQLEQCCVYRVWDHAGHRLRTRTFGLQLNNPHDPPVTSLGRNGYGRRSPNSAHVYGQVASREVIVQQVRKQLLQFPDLPFVSVRQQVIGPLDARRVGMVKEQTWKIHNPLHAERTSQRRGDPQR